MCFMKMATKYLLTAPMAAAVPAVRATSPVRSTIGILRLAKASDQNFSPSVSLALTQEKSFLICRPHNPHNLSKDLWLSSRHRSVSPALTVSGFAPSALPELITN